MYDYNVILGCIKEHIDASGLDHAEIAKCMHVRVKTLDKYLSGESMPSVLQIRDLSILLGVSANELLGLDKVRVEQLK